MTETERQSAGLRDRIESALSSDDPRLGRLSGAGTSVSFEVTDSPEESVTLLLDRNPPSVATDDEPAEITIELTGQQAARMARGTLSLPSALWGGSIAYRGPVRKYLVVDPVLRGILAEQDGSHH